MSFVTLKTGPMGISILLPSEEVAGYEALVDSVNEQFRPDSYQEKLLAQAIVDHQWRLRRISSMEEGLYALGRKKLAAAHLGESDPKARAALIDSQILIVYRKQFKQLAQQGRFLRKRLKGDTAELNQLLRENPRSTRRGLFLVPKRQRP